MRDPSSGSTKSKGALVPSGGLWTACAAPPSALAPASKRAATGSAGGGADEGEGASGGPPVRGPCALCGCGCPHPREVLLQYSEEALVHGVHYFSRRDISYAERALWVVAVGVCAVFACLFMQNAWSKYMMAPITTTVETTSYPLYRMPFAAVTICPATNVRRSVGERLLLRALGEDEAAAEGNATLRNLLWHTMSALSKLQHPFFVSADEHLVGAAPLLPRLAALNVSHFMQQALPPCKDVFFYCFWQGRNVSCCEEFHLQRFEGGFCYSFNSLTSDDKSACANEIYDEGVDDAKAGLNASSDRCLLRHNTACGTATGLELLLKPVDPDDSLGSGQRLADGYTVLVHQPDAYPEDSSGLYVAGPREGGAASAGAVSIRAALTESGDDVRALPPAVRNCFFGDESRLLVARRYTLHSCLLECRLRHLARQCRCLPYFFSSLALPGVPECSLVQMRCLSKHSLELRFLRPPERMAGVEGKQRERLWQRLRERGIDCSHCLPTCHDNTYDLKADTVSDTLFDRSNFTYVDIFYKDLYAVKYGREVSFGQTELLVSFGGIASLFLGVSLLSGFELVYYVCKLCASLALTLWCGGQERWRGRGRVAPRRPRARARAAANAAAFAAAVHAATGSGVWAGKTPPPAAVVER